MEIQIVNVETGEETLRDMTPAELKEYEAAQQEAQAADAAREATAAERQAILIKLGLTEEEAAILLGT
jgi:acyl-CoA reductase-like NAD-dependent aldehyde dehydrogenase